MALFFFTGALWALGRDGQLDLGDGLVLVGIFLFWQVLHIFDVLKYNIHRRRSLPWTIFGDILLVVLLGAGVLQGIDRLVTWIMALGPGFILYDHLGILSGCLMVLPNAILAAYYAWAGRADIVYSSQVGDGHICIPMCIGLFALFCVIQVPAQMTIGIVIILAAGLLHLFLYFRHGPPSPVHGCDVDPMPTVSFSIPGSWDNIDGFVKRPISALRDSLVTAEYSMYASFLVIRKP